MKEPARESSANNGIAKQSSQQAKTPQQKVKEEQNTYNNATGDVEDPENDEYDSANAANTKNEEEDKSNDGSDDDDNDEASDDDGSNGKKSKNDNLYKAKKGGVTGGRGKAMDNSRAVKGGDASKQKKKIPVDGGRSDKNDNNKTRTKERTITDIIEKVSTWRKLYNGVMVPNPQNNE